MKSKTHILFIDDQEFGVLNILKNNGWLNTTRVDDIENLHDHRIRAAHIIMVDIHGVGRALQFADEGLGLTKALKQRYPEKRVIVYSAESSGDRFNDGLSIADWRLRKNSDPIEFLTLVEKYSQEAFSIDQCANRLQSVLKDEFGLSMSSDDIVLNILELRNRGGVTDDAVLKVFNIDRIGSVASIISLLLSAYPKA